MTNHIIAGGGDSGLDLRKIVLELHIRHAAKFRAAPWWKRTILNTWIRLEAARIYHSRLYSR
jgi:hypothetical protein